MIKRWWAKFKPRLLKWLDAYGEELRKNGGHFGPF